MTLGEMVKRRGLDVDADVDVDLGSWEAGSSPSPKPRQAVTKDLQTPAEQDQDDDGPTRDRFKGSDQVTFVNRQMSQDSTGRGRTGRHRVVRALAALESFQSSPVEVHWISAPGCPGGDGVTSSAVAAGVLVGDALTNAVNWSSMWRRKGMPLALHGPRPH